MTAAATMVLALVLAQGHGPKVAGNGAAKRAGASAPAPRAGEPAKRTSRAGGSGDSGGAAASGGEAGSGSAGGDSGKTAGDGATTAAGGTKLKTKTYNFGAMDVEGKLKTPQLLYFLNRVKLELDMSAPDKRSFMKELEKSAEDKNL
jgi:hypothetical protein